MNEEATTFDTASLSKVLDAVEGAREKMASLEPAVIDSAVEDVVQACALLDSAAADLRAISETVQASAQDGEDPEVSLALTPDDLDGLPQELLDELNLTEVDKFEGFIVRAVRAAGGVSTLDKLLIAWWRETKEVQKRQPFNAKLYRMTRKRILWTVPNRKGVYTTDRAIGEGKKDIF